MPSVNKTSRRERSEREIAAVLVLHAKGYSVQEIDDETDVRSQLSLGSFGARQIPQMGGIIIKNVLDVLLPLMLELIDV
jgi:hypothetical protein